MAETLHREPIRFGLIGAGRMGQVYAHHLSSGIPGAKLVALADTDTSNAYPVAARYGVPGYTDYTRLLDRADVDAVIVATTTRTHPEVVRAAAAAGKHIFCEKPLALTVADCDAAIAAVEAAGVALQVGFMRRYDRPYAAAKEKIDAGVIGKPVMFKSVGRDPRRSSLEFARRENSGGLIVDMAIHDFDLARWLMGAEVVRVQSEGACLVYPELAEVGDIDNAVINLKFANGAVGNVDVSRNAVYGYDIRTEVMGSEGSLQIGTLQQTALLVLDARGVTHDTVPYFMERFGDAYAAQIRDFAARLREGRAPAVTGRDARAATAIAVAATRSFDERRVVELDEVMNRA